jgi:hypothetical protein
MKVGAGKGSVGCSSQAGSARLIGALVISPARRKYSKPVVWNPQIESSPPSVVGKAERPVHRGIVAVKAKELAVF